MARLANLGPTSPHRIRENSRQRSRGDQHVNDDRQDEEQEVEERESQTLGARKTKTIRKIKEDLGFDLAEVFSCWPASLEARDLGLNTLMVLEELLRIFSRYQGLDGRQIRLRLAETVPKGKKPTYGPLKKLLKIVQAASESGQHLASSRSNSEQRGTRSEPDSDLESDLESSSKASGESFEKEGINSETWPDKESEEVEKEPSIELGRNVLMKRSGDSKFTHSSDNIDLDQDHLPLKNPSSSKPGNDQSEDELSFLPDDRQQLLSDEQINLPRDEYSSPPLNDPNGSPSPNRSAMQLGQSTRIPPKLRFSVSERASVLPSPKPDEQHEYPSKTQSKLHLSDNKCPTFAPELGFSLPRITTPQSTQSPAVDMTVQCGERAAGYKDVASEDHENHNERSLRHASQSPEEDQTRASLQAALAEARSKHYDAIKKHQTRQTSCIKICEVVDRAERKLAASCGTRLGTQDLQDCTAEVLRQKATVVRARQEKRAKQHLQLMHVTKRQEQRLEAMLKAREKMWRTEGTIRRIEALLEDMPGSDASSSVDGSCDDDGEVDSLMAGLNDESS